MINMAVTSALMHKVAAGGPVVYWSDTFTDVANTLLELHTPDVGSGGYTKVAGAFKIDAGGTQLTAAGAGGNLHTFSTGQTSIIIKATYIGGISRGLIVRYLSSLLYHLLYEYSGVLYIAAYEYGNFITKASVAAALAPGDTFSLSDNGSVLRGFINGVEKISYTTVVNYAETTQGIRVYGLGGLDDLTVVAGPGPAVGITTVFNDTFTDTDSTLLQNHTPEIGGPWVVLNGTLEIFNNELRAQVAGDCMVDTSTSSILLTAVLGSIAPTGVTLSIRVASLSDRISVYLSGSYFQLYEVINGLWWTKASVNVSQQAGDTITITDDGSTIIAKLNGGIALLHITPFNTGVTKQAAKAGVTGNYWTSFKVESI